MPGDLPKAVGAAVLRDEWEPPQKSGPMTNPLDRYGHLPEGKRRWLENLPDETMEFLADLRADDIAEIREAIRFQRSAKTIGRFFRALAIVVAGAITATVLAGEKIAIAWKWVSGK